MKIYKSKILHLLGIILLALVSIVIIGNSIIKVSPAEIVETTEVPTTIETEVKRQAEVLTTEEETVTEVVEETTEVVEEVTEVVETTVEGSSYSVYEYDLLARLICAEGQTESYETKLKIGSVVLNRVNDSYFPNTIKEVIYQKNQFSVTTIYRNGKPMIDHQADVESLRAAKELLENGSVLPPKVQVFYENSVTTGWVSTRQVYGTFDNTTFAYIY